MKINAGLYEVLCKRRRINCSRFQNFVFSKKRSEPKSLLNYPFAMAEPFSDNIVITNHWLETLLNNIRYCKLSSQVISTNGIRESMKYIYYKSCSSLVGPSLTFFLLFGTRNLHYAGKIRADSCGYVLDFVHRFVMNAWLLRNARMPNHTDLR